MIRIGMGILAAFVGLMFISPSASESMEMGCFTSPSTITDIPCATPAL